MMLESILVEGNWQHVSGVSSFRAREPATREMLPCEFLLSKWWHIDRAFTSATAAARELRNISGDQLGQFLSSYADDIEAAADLLVAAAHHETALPKHPRLSDVELPRTTTQLRQAADAAREGSWMRPVIDRNLNPRALQRFGVLQRYDAVRASRLPRALQDAAPHGACGA